MRPVAAFVGLRYLRAQRANQFASFVSIASVIGVALGVAALIVVLSVMNGFESELRARLLSLAGHASVEPSAEAVAWRDIVDEVSAREEFVAAAPFVELEVMLSSGRTLAGAMLTGVLPELESGISEVGRHMREGALSNLEPGAQGIILGRALALKLGLRSGDVLTVMAPRKQAGRGLDTVLREFTIVGMFELGLRDHDGVRALVHLDDARVLTGKAETGVRIKTADAFSAPWIVRDWLAERAVRGAPALDVRDWTQDNATYFRAVRIEKIMMTLLLSLIVAVAVFNIVATLVMTVTDKRSGIAIMRTLGYSRSTIVQIFAVQGIVIGWIGVVVGIAMGVTLALNIESLAPKLEQLFGFEFMPADVYYLTSLPAELHSSDVLWVTVIALLMTALATIYPAVRASGVAPAEVLRYE
ncbi:MAG: lipoprotein-releasing ABC transporter permease subunit [Gammaproteobacteria bacterium]